MYTYMSSAAAAAAPPIHIFLSDRRFSAFSGCRLHNLVLFRRAPPRIPPLRLSSSSLASRGNPAHDDDHPQGSHAGEVVLSQTPSSDGTPEGNPPAKARSTNELKQKLERYGVAGVLSYGLFNTAYYLTTFLVVWFYIAPAPARMGYMVAVERFIKIMAMVWAGSQVTKLIRAGGALALAPLVDKGLSWFTIKFKFESKAKAFAAIAGLCFGLVLLLFVVLTLLWA